VARAVKSRGCALHFAELDVETDGFIADSIATSCGKTLRYPVTI
jgi:hypothetical protein